MIRHFPRLNAACRLALGLVAALVSCAGAMAAGRAETFPAGVQSPGPMLAATALVGSAPVESAQRCTSVGLFDAAEDAKRFALALAEIQLSAVPRSEAAEVTVGYVVLAPKQATPDETRALAKRLREHGVHDQLMMGKGPFKGHIALGTYNGPRSADRRREQLVEMGFPALVQARTAPGKRWWIDIEHVDDDGANSTFRQTVEGVAPDRTLLWIRCPRVVTAFN